MRILLLVVPLLVVHARASNACSFLDEPPLSLLLRRAVASAGIEPERVASMRTRSRAAAVLPRVQALAGKGRYDYIRNADSLQPTLVSSDTWRFEVTATWSLDHLVFSPSEPRLIEASGRLAERRAQLVDRVVDLWTQRRALDRPGPLSTVEVDRCEALTAVLDALTRGALTESRAPPDRSLSLPAGGGATR